MIKENKIKKYVVVIICLLGMLILSGKTENVFANDKKSKDMENSLLSFYIKDVSNVESIRYIPLDKKIIGNKRITDKSNVVDIGFGEYYIKAKDEKKELQEPSYSSWYEAPKGGMQFREKLSIEYQVNKDYNNKNLRILKKVVEEKKKWIYEKLENASKEKYKPGCKVSILGKEYPLKIKYFKQSVSNIYIDDGILVVELSRRNKKNYQEKIESLLDDVYMKIAEKEVPMAMEIVTRIVGIKPNKYRIRKIKSAWGTCSANKNITINSYLMKYDRNAIQYVVLHEICHLKYMNHSEEFWNMVEKYMKNYKEVRKKLKE